MWTAVVLLVAVANPKIVYAKFGGEKFDVDVAARVPELMQTLRKESFDMCQAAAKVYNEARPPMERLSCQIVR